jgi:two-component system KDP operon response regulator KdpE
LILRLTLPESHVLVVDDEKSLRDFIRRNLDVRGYRVQTAANGLEALALIHAENFDLIILDLMMPHMDGLETTRRVREHSVVPIIILTALGEENDKIRAFDLGADDYLTKPFGVEELLARVRAVLRRSSWRDIPVGEERQVLHRAGVSLDLEQRLVTSRGQEIDLTPTEFELLNVLMRNAGIVLSHRDLLHRVWGPEYQDEVEYVRVYIGRLRRKLERDPLKPELLLTERGVGYRFTRE